MNYLKVNLLFEKDIPSIVNEYEIAGKNGIGIVFIVQSLIKIPDDKKGSMYVTFFDIQTKNVLLTKLMSGKPGGIGFRNYRAKTIKDVLDQIRY